VASKLQQFGVVMTTKACMGIHDGPPLLRGDPDRRTDEATAEMVKLQ